MPTDPNIIGGLRPPQFADPLQQAGQAMSLAAARQHLAMAPIQMQEAQEKLKSSQLANQEAMLKQRDDQILTDSYQRADGDPKKHIQMAAAMGARPQAVQSLDKHYADIREQYAKTAKDENEVQKYQNSQVKGILESAMQDPNYEQNWGQYKQSALAVNPKLQLPDEPLPKDQLPALRLRFATDEQLRADADERRKQAEDKRASDLHPFKVAEAQATQLKNDADQQARENPDNPALQARAVSAAQRLEKAEKDRSFQELARHNQATEKNANTLASIAVGRLNVEKEHADIARNIYEQTYGEGANPALVGVEPKLRTQAAKAAQGAADEYGKAVQSLSNVQTFIDLAKSGNKAAGSNLPIMGAESIQALNGIRRINRTEIEQYQGAGSLLDRINGRIGKLTAGQPIPKDVMADIESLHKAIGGNAAETYNKKLDSVNQNYHANFKPAVTAKPSTAAPEITSQAAYDALAKGAQYTHNGEVLTKK